LGIWSVVIFAATFIVGVFFRGAGVAGREYTELKKLVDVRKTRLREGIKQLEALKDADLGTIQQQLPPIIQAYADTFSATVASLLSQATQQKKAEDAQAYIKQAISELKRLL
jgi:macrodomain Ter protein organizer (MatP/YcbG family)